MRRAGSWVADVVGGGALAGFGELVDALGGSGESILDRFGFDLAAVGDPSASISLVASARAIEAAALDLGCPDFGLRLAEVRGVGSLGPIAGLLDHAPTVGAAAGAIVGHLALYSPAMRVQFTKLDARQGRLVYTMHIPGVADQRQSNELALGIAHRILQTLTGVESVASVVYLPHRLNSSRMDYYQRFGCRVLQNQPFCGIDFPLELLDRPLRDARPHVHAAIREDLSRWLGPIDDFVVSVIELVEIELASDSADLGLVATRLGLHPRTLQRRLADRGVRFADLVDDVRRTRAERYLVESDIPLALIADQLGYSEQSCLSRSCIRWFGRTPTEVRWAAVT